MNEDDINIADTFIVRIISLARTNALLERVIMQSLDLFDEGETEKAIKLLKNWRSEMANNRS